MVHTDIYKIFKQYFPEFEDKTMIWFQNGKNSIRAELNTKQQLIFTFNSERDWKLETRK